jgi:hypothetical protein
MFYFIWFAKTHPGVIRQGHPLTDFIITLQAFNALAERSPDEQRQAAANILRAMYEHLEEQPPVTGLRNDPPDVGVIIRNPGMKITEYWRGE